MIFIDSNIPMYVIGEDHPNKALALRILEALARGGNRLVTSAEVFQEILHRYSAINRREAIQPAWEVLEALCDEVFSVHVENVLAARSLLLAYNQLSSRDALHITVMQEHKVTRVLTFDSGFDALAGIERIPAR